MVDVGVLIFFMSSVTASMQKNKEVQGVPMMSCMWNVRTVTGPDCRNLCCCCCRLFLALSSSATKG